MRFISKVFELIVAHVYMRIISIFHFVCDLLADILIDLIVCQLVLLILCVDNKKSSNNDLFVSFKNRYILLFCLRYCFDYTSVTLQWDASRMSLLHEKFNTGSSWGSCSRLRNLSTSSLLSLIVNVFSFYQPFSMQ